MNIKLLMIEDDPDQRKLLASTIDTYLLRHKQHKIEYTMLPNDNDFYKLVFNNKFDCIILDLRWDDNIVGREIIESIVLKKRIPVIVYSGNIAEIDDLEERIGFKKYHRTKPFNEIIDEIIAVKEMKVFDLLGYEGSIEENILKLFWDDNEFINNLPTTTNPDALTRVITTRVVEKLSHIRDVPTGESFEFYIYPAVKQDVSNGDIYKLTKKDDISYYLVITPACQIVRGRVKVKNVNLIKIDFTHTIIRALMKPENTPETKKNKLNELIKAKDRYHFLPPFNKASLNVGLIDFNDITSVAIEEIAGTSFTKVASINPHYMKDIQARFSQFYSKQGYPDYSQDELLEVIFSSPVNK